MSKDKAVARLEEMQCNTCSEYVTFCNLEEIIRCLCDDEEKPKPEDNWSLEERKEWLKNQWKFTDECNDEIDIAFGEKQPDKSHPKPTLREVLDNKLKWHIGQIHIDSITKAITDKFELRVK